jgi:type IV pilus assembly protein PilA
MKKMNNNGFSLVELIVVIAIMAILVGVLAPSVLGQLDKAKISKDKQTIETIVTAAATAYADQMVTDKPSTYPAEVTAVAFGDSAVAFSGSSDGTFTQEVQSIVGYTTVALESNGFNNATVKIEIQQSGKVTATVSGADTEALNEFTVTR